jgi:hypothetical protein
MVLRERLALIINVQLLMDGNTINFPGNKNDG